MKNILVHLSGGIGDVIMATPMIAALADKGHSVDILLEADFSMQQFFSSWSPLIHVSEDRNAFKNKSYDFYVMGWILKTPLLIDKRKTTIITLEYSMHLPKVFVSQSDLALQAAKAIDPSINLDQETYCGYSQRKFPEISSKTVVIYCGCKIMFAIKRWDKFAALAERFEDVAVVGVPSDLDNSFSYSYPPWVFQYFHKYLKHNGKLKRVLNLFGKQHYDVPQFGSHVKNFIGQLSLFDTAALIHQAGLFIGNDGGLSHVAAALGKPTAIIFGPSSLEMVRIRRDNVLCISKQLDCQPCQLGGKYPQAWKYWGIGCPVGIQCLKSLSVDEVYEKSMDFWDKQQSLNH